MRVVIAGTRSFGRAVLEAVEQKHDVVGIVAPLDDKLHHASLYRDAAYAPELNDQWLRAQRADILLGAHTHAYVGQRSRKATPLGALIGHPSLLPRHRGRDAVEWTVRFRDPVAGFTLFWADAGIDTGPIVSQDWCHVDPTWDASDLWREALFPMGVRLFVETLDVLEGGAYPAVAQDRRFATFEPAVEVPSLHRPELPELLPGPSARARS